MASKHPFYQRIKGTERMVYVGNMEVEPRLNSVLIPIREPIKLQVENIEIAPTTMQRTIKYNRVKSAVGDMFVGDVE